VIDIRRPGAADVGTGPACGDVPDWFEILLLRPKRAVKVLDVIELRRGRALAGLPLGGLLSSDMIAVSWSLVSRVSAESGGS
jgi:hypothetical protein